MARDSLQKLKKRYDAFFAQQQSRIASTHDGLLLLSALGILAGATASVMIIFFRVLLDTNLFVALIQQPAHGFADLPPLIRFALCVFGACAIAALLSVLPQARRDTGIAYVLTRLQYHQARLSFRNAVVQTIVASIALLSGQSMGREGPSVHLGATAGSLVGRWFNIPNNGLRILLGAGVAAAIASAFDTPLAGVIFAMEVIVMEYTVIGFTPIILAAVTATTLTRVFYPDTSLDVLTSLPDYALTELPFVALLGFSVGIIAATFTQIATATTRITFRASLWLRLPAAGILTGLIAMWLPQIMGIGYESISDMALGHISLNLIMAILLAKLIATSVSVGLGMPAGLIGPTLFIGAAAGSALSLTFSALDLNSGSLGWHVVLGMASMMAATLHAPLAALIYLLELTGSSSVLLPGMLAVVSATLICHSGFKKQSIYHHLMHATGRDIKSTQLATLLRKVGVASIVNRNIAFVKPTLRANELAEVLELHPDWLVIVETPTPTFVLPAADAALYLDGQVRTESSDTTGEVIDLLTIPAIRRKASTISIVATLEEAHKLMTAESVDVLLVAGNRRSNRKKVYGVVTQQQIVSSYQ